MRRPQVEPSPALTSIRSHPARFVHGAPEAPALPTAVWINKPIVDQSDQIEITHQTVGEVVVAGGGHCDRAQTSAEPCCSRPMQRLVVLLLVPVLACSTLRRAEVPRDASAEGDACATSCRYQGGGDEAVLSCVSRCPGAVTADAGCDARRPNPGRSCVQAGSDKAGLTLVALVGGFLLLAGGLIAIGANFPRT